MTENIRTKALFLLKQNSAAFIDKYTRNNNEKEAVARSQVYLNEFSDLLSSKEYADTCNKSNLIKPTKLKVPDLFQKRKCAGQHDVSCKRNEVSNEDVKDFVGLLKKKNLSDEKDINFEKDFKFILNNIDAGENSLELSDDVKTSFSLSDPIISTQNSDRFIRKARRNSDVDKIIPSKSNEKSIGTNVFKNPFKRPKIDLTDDVASIFKNARQTSPKENVTKQEFNEFGMQKSHKENFEIFRSRMKTDDQPSKPKRSNPWKEERLKKIPEFQENKREFPTNQFSAKPAINLIKYDCDKTSIPKNSFDANDDYQKFNTVKTRLNNNKIEEKKDDTNQSKPPYASFRTGNQELEWQKNLQKKPPQRGLSKSHAVKINEQMPNSDIDPLRKKFHCPSFPKAENAKKTVDTNDDDLPAELKGFDKELLKRIEREIVIDSREVDWDDIIGLDGAKKVIKESVILAIQRPDLFTGLRESSRAIMLFGPPGTGKTLIGKCIASSCDATFMSVSASSLTSKWIGESETLVRAMFTYAKIKQPCVIFFDEIDSLLEKRSEQGNETFNRIKTEFLVQLDGANALKKSDKVLLIGATNRPDVIDEAILRRFTKRILVPLPVKQARTNMIVHLLSKHCHTLSHVQIDKLSDYCDKYSGSDIAQVCKEAAMMSIRRMDSETIECMKVDDLPPISPKDFLNALRNVKPTVSQETILKLDDWNSKYGSTIDTSCAIEIDDDDFLNDFEL